LPMNRKGLRKSPSKLWDNKFRGTQTNRKCKYRERLNSYTCTVSEIQLWKCPKSLYLATPLRFNPLPPPPTEGFPWDDLRKIFIEILQMAKVPNGVETLPKISSAWVGCWVHVARMLETKDRQTIDEWRLTTERRAGDSSERERSLKLESVPK